MSAKSLTLTALYSAEQGHLTEIAAIAWTRDDSRIVSIGGSHLYHWSTATWQRIPDQELYDKSLVHLMSLLPFVRKLLPGTAWSIHF